MTTESYFSRFGRVADKLGLIPFMVIAPGAVTFVLTPLVAYETFTGTKVGKELTPEIDAGVGLIRLLGVFASAVVLFMIVSWMTESPKIQRTMARNFAVYFVVWTAVVITNWRSHPEEYDARTMGMLLTAFLISTIITLVQCRAEPDEPSREKPGKATTLSVTLWFLWLLQGQYFVVSGVALLVFTAKAAHLFLVPSLADNLFLQAQLRIVPSYLLSLGFFCFTGMTHHNEYQWRPFGRVFMFLLAALPCAVILMFTPLIWSPWVFAWFVPCGLFLVGNLLGLARPRPTWVDDVPEAIHGWIQPDLAAGPPMGVQTLTTRRRASHLMGVGARGTFKVADRLPMRHPYPENDFFVPGREFDVRMRFANLTELDDAGLDVRGAALKLADTEWESPFDMVMNTGSFCPASNLVEFTGFVVSKWLPPWGSRILVEGNPIAMEGGVAGLRRAPETFAGLTFYSQIIRGWLTPDNTQHLVRYRVVSADGLKETGLPDADDCSHIWIRTRRPTDHRPSDYLRQEFKERLRRGHVRFEFQAQFHPFWAGIAPQWYDASTDWDEADHPWITLGEITLTEALKDEVTERMRFSPGNKPESLFVFSSPGLLDPRSLGDSEIRVMVRLQKLRLWLERFGRLPFGPVAQVPGADR